MRFVFFIKVLLTVLFNLKLTTAASHHKNKTFKQNSLINIELLLILTSYAHIATYALHHNWNIETSEVLSCGEARLYPSSLTSTNLSRIDLHSLILPLFSRFSHLPRKPARMPPTNRHCFFFYLCICFIHFLMMFHCLLLESFLPPLHNNFFAPIYK